MSFGDYISLGAEVVQIKPKAILRAADDEGAFGMGIAFIAIGAAASALGSWNLPGIIMLPVIALFVAFIITGLLHILATALGGQGDFLRLFRPLALAYVLDWLLVVGLVLNFLPFLGQMVVALLNLGVALWKLVVGVVIVENVYALTRGKAIAAVGIIVGIFLLLVLVLATVAGAALFGLFMASQHNA